jgi:hypothetical protein
MPSLARYKNDGKVLSSNKARTLISRVTNNGMCFNSVESTSKILATEETSFRLTALSY